MNKESKKKLIDRYGNTLSKIYRLLKGNKFSVGGGNSLSINGVFAARCVFNVAGKDNQIQIEPGVTRLNGCKITVKGSNCKIVIGKDSNLNNVELYIENDYGEIIIGNHVTMGKTHLAVIEGKRISIGNDCLFSSEIVFRVGDSHSILNNDTRERINPSLDISVGNHVWIGHSVKVLKGAKISDNSIIATGAIVTGKQYPEHCIIGGTPAKVIKENVDWCSERI